MENAIIKMHGVTAITHEALSVLKLFLKYVWEHWELAGSFKWGIRGRKKKRIKN